MKNKTKLIHLLCFLSSFAISAQISFIEDTVQVFEGASQGSLAFADIDNDGDQDFLTTGLNIDLDTLTTLYLNDGFGKFIKNNNTPFTHVTHGDIAFGDIDNDGDKDLIIAGLGIGNISSTKLFINDGGDFVEMTNTPFTPLTHGKVAFADIDNDGDEDVIISGTKINPGGFDQLVSAVYLNDGLGSFSSSSNNDFTTFGSFDLADVDGDDDIDILISGSSNLSPEPTATLFLNTGNGNFVEQVNTSFVGVVGATVNFADIDADADMDVLITGSTSFDFTSQSSELYINDGAGNFTVMTDALLQVDLGACGFADLDFDQDVEMLITGRSLGGFSQATVLYSNDGNGLFDEVSDLPFIDIREGAIAFVDVDGDTDNDLFITGFNSNNISQSKLYLNDLMVSSTESPDIFHSMIVYPNPFDEYLKMSFENIIGSKIVELRNVLGQLVWTKKIVSSSEIEISTMHLDNGLYFLNIKNKKGESETIPIYKK